MFARLKQAKKRLHNLMRLHSKSFRNQLEGILLHYPAEEIKTADEIYRELRFLINNRRFENVTRELEYYLRSGMHLKGADVSTYISFLEWMEAFLALNAAVEGGAPSFSNKRETSERLSALGFRVAEFLGKLYPGSAAKTLPPLLAAHEEIFCKPLDLYGGKGCMKLRRSEDDGGCLANGKFLTWQQLEETLNHLDSDKQPEYFILEECICQHSHVSAIHASSINTLRLFSVREADGTFSYLQGIIRIGAGGACVDNATSGGFFVGLNAEGCLLDRAHCWRHEAPIPMFRHPDTDVLFKDYALPFFTEAKEMICAAHAAFSPQMLLLAWDVAITPTGPLIVEINDFGSISLMQRAHGGWLPIYNRYVKPELERLGFTPA